MLFKKKMVNGKKAPHYYYRVMVNGKLHIGSTGCTTIEDARKFEREFVSQFRLETSEKAVLVKLHEKVSGGRRIKLEDAWKRFLQKPRDRAMGDQRRQAVESRWNDFLAFLKDTYPMACHMNEVSAQMADAYIQHLREKGRWNKSVTFQRKGHRGAVSYTQKATHFSPAAQNAFLQTARQIFALLLHEAGCVDNPFTHIKPVKNQAETREAFTPEELKLIGKAATGELYSLFLTGISTGLREGDICTLKWSEVDLDKNRITRQMLKTRKTVVLPILPGLRSHLESLPRTGDYVFPELATLYTTNRSGIGYRVRSFLDDLDIVTTRSVKDRDRVISVKDVHSLRHTFVYLAGLHGVPLPVVQAVVGHFSPAMTQLYMNHATEEAKTRELAKMPNYLKPVEETPAERQERIMKELGAVLKDADLKLLEAAKTSIDQLIKEANQGTSGEVRQG